jgi:hypothetical protein
LAKLIIYNSLAYSYYSSGTLDIERFINSNNSLVDFLNKEELDLLSLVNLKKYYKIYGNLIDLY